MTSLSVEERRRQWRESSQRYAKRYRERFAAQLAAQEAAKLARWRESHKPRTGVYASANLVIIDKQVYLMPDGVGVFTPHTCTQCGCRCAGLEPVYSLKEAAALIPMPTVGALRVWLSGNKDLVSKPRLYKQARLRRTRYLSLSDILRIRKIIFNPFRKGNPHTIEGKFIKAAAKLDSETEIRDIISDVLSSPAVADAELGRGGDNS